MCTKLGSSFRLLSMNDVYNEANLHVYITEADNYENADKKQD